MSIDPKQPADTALPFDPAVAGWEPYGEDDTGFIGLVGPWWMRKKGDGYEYACLTELKHSTNSHVVQPGLLMTFADRSMGRTCWYANGQRDQATVQLNVQIIDAVKVGEFVEAHCTVVWKGLPLVFMSASLKVGDRVVATANGLWKILGER